MKTSKADTWFSRFIRLRDAQESNGVLFAKCVTCPKVKEVKHMDCGHYVKRQHKATRYSELNCHIQCKRCNAFEQGRDEKFAQAIDKRYGKGTAYKLKLESKKYVKLDESIIETYYKELINNILEQRGWQKLKWW